MNTIEVVPVGGPVGAEIRGVDLSQELNADDLSKIKSAFAQYGVVFFRDQKITPDEHVRFTAHFGELEVMSFSRFSMPDKPEVLQLTNIQENGKNIGVHDAGKEWHADSTYMQKPSYASFLYAREVPHNDQGEPLGDTLFAPAFGHFEELDADRRELLSSMKAIHTLDNRLVKKGETPPQLAIHPVVVTHPITGRKCLFVNEGRCKEFVGLNEEESKVLLNNLLERLKSPERVYRHKWRVGDLLMWDNISTQHLATHDYSWPQHRRLMHRTTVKGMALS